MSKANDGLDGLDPAELEGDFASRGGAGQDPLATAHKAESSGCTLGVSLALVALCLTILGVLSLLILPKVLESDVDVDKLVAQNFVDGSIPFDLLASGAREFQGRAVILRLAKAGIDQDREAERRAWEEAAKLATQDASKAPQLEVEAGDSPEDAKPVQPKQKAMQPLDVEPGSLNPDELLLVSYAKVSMLIDAFKTNKPDFGGFGETQSDADISRKAVAWTEDASYAWKTTLMRDKVRWDGWEADFQIERAYRVGGAWGDLVKLNLGLGKRNLALYARWPDGYAVAREDVERLASSVRM